MEFFILNKANYHKLISEEDEFYYPLIFQTSLLNSRFLGKNAQMPLKDGNEYEGTLIGVINLPLIEHFLQYSRSILENASLGIDENEMEWLKTHVKSARHFQKIRFNSKPKSAPHYILVNESLDAVVFAAFSESELSDIPKINYNKIIMNESIEKLTSYVKTQLPHALKQKAGKKRSQSLETKIKQLRISRFLKVEQEKLK